MIPLLAAFLLGAAAPPPVPTYAAARAALAAGRPEAALAILREAEDVPPRWGDLAIARAEAALGRLDEAVGRLERVVDAEGGGASDGLSPIGRRALALSAELLLAGGRPAAAADRYRDLAVSDTDRTPRWLFAAAQALEAAGETAAAYRTYGAILWGYPESGFAHRGIGRMDALRAAGGADLPPPDPYEVFLAGKVSLERGDALSAEAKFRTLEEGVVDVAMRDDILYYAGIAAMRLSKYDEALSRFRTLRGDFPRSPYFHQSGLRILQTYIYRGEDLNPYLFRLYLREGTGEEAEEARLDLARFHRSRGALRESLDLYAGVQGARSIEARWEEALVYEDLGDRENWERSLTAVLAQAETAAAEADAVRYARARRDEVEGRLDEALEAYARLAGEGRHPYYLAKAREAVLRLAANRYREGAAEKIWNDARTLAARGETLAAYGLWRTIAFGYPETTFRAEALEAIRLVLADLPGWAAAAAPPESAAATVEEPAAAIGLTDAQRRILETVRALARAGAPDEAADLLRDLPSSPARLAALARLAAAAGDVPGALAAGEDLLSAWPVAVDRILLPDPLVRILHPLPYAARFRAAADTFGVEAPLLAAIARRASRFDPTAVSGVRIGLLGLDPVAAEWAADRVSLDLGVVDLFQPDTNILLGSLLVATAHEAFGREAHLTAAAHWAGPGNVEAWLAAGLPRDEDRFIERIPFPEARAFARDVLAGYRVYRALSASEGVVR